ncbi:MAG TPA: aldehyde dehydrogenase family protein [Polyangiaceae bacterium]|jgi:acyl-CoA reductase-like NAD-dependent aldehyde dehydrogenase|nr:aldehyde dehydrogenase family protein [Polyangiaceae bacterium]
MTTEGFSTRSPIDGSEVVARKYTRPPEVQASLTRAVAAQKKWKQVSVADRIALVTKAVDAFVKKRDVLAEEITRQMGRPISQSPGEVRGFEDRARYMLSVAEEALSDVDVGKKEGFTRFVRREPLGVALVIAPWNYPFLTAVNSVVPALLAGNTVLLRHSPQTPLAAERIVEAFREAGMPEGVLQFLHTSDEDTDKLVETAGIDFVAFTGSVRVGHLIQKHAVARFIPVGLELGGKDAAYVRADANLDHAVENLVDGAFFNSGQSCCGIERIYVAAGLYDRFVEGYVALTRQYRLGNPLEASTNLGPLVRASAAEFVRGQIAEAVSAGARALIDPKSFAADSPGTPYLAPQVLVGVNHSMRVMTEETFGPVVGIMKVNGDDEAVEFINDSPYGLTSAIWTSDESAATAIGSRLEVGTVFQNRCDYLDPALAWTGVKDSGRGVTLSRLGYETLTRPKSFHLRSLG